MILQRAAQHIRRRDWSTVLVEIIIVIVGILIALQVDNWNEDRKARAQADIWRDAIIGDLRATQRGLQARINYYEQGLAFAEIALPNMRSDTPLSADENWDTVLGAFQASQIWPLRINDTTYREVQAAGMLYTIGPRDIMTRLTNYYEITAFDVSVIAGGSPPYRDMVREKMPWSIQEYIWENDCQSTSTNAEDGGYTFELVRCAKPDLDVDIAAAVSRFRGDRELRDKLRGRMSQLKIVIAAFDRNIRHIEVIIQNLEQGA